VKDPDPDDGGRPRKVYSLTERGEFIIGVEKNGCDFTDACPNPDGGGGK